MLKKSIAVVFAIALAMTATVASAQCTIAAYGDAAGTQSLLEPQLDQQGDTFSLYVVMFVEDTATAAAYKINIPDLNSTVFLANTILGPTGDGLIIEEPTGDNVALGECVYGFFGEPILVAEYVLQPIVGSYAGGQVTLEANTSQGATPVYVTCTDITKPCDVGPSLTLNAPVDNEPSSFGSIKSLYH